MSLDGDGSTTFIVVTAAMLPIYQRLEMSPVVLTCVAGLINGALNIVPWGGPTARASSALQIDANEIFAPMVPSLVAGLLVCLVFAYFLGISERRRLAKNGVTWVADRGAESRRELVGAVAGNTTSAAGHVRPAATAGPGTGSTTATSGSGTEATAGTGGGTTGASGTAGAGGADAGQDRKSVV